MSFSPLPSGGTCVRYVLNGLLCSTITKRKNISTTATVATTSDSMCLRLGKAAVLRALADSSRYMVRTEPM